MSQRLLKMELRATTPADSPAIASLFESVFTDSEGPQEGALIRGLVSDLMADTAGEDIVGFVATDSRQLLGAIFFSRLRFKDRREVFMLAPVAVATDHQGQGIGQALIRFGLQAMKARGVDFVITYGDPNYYSRVGFQALSQATAPAPFKLSQPQGWLGQPLSDTTITPVKGPSSCVKAFDNPAYW